jgi:UDP-N-acetylmuramoyl-tripeptide--D-alanyl-D-alanine ligase
MIAMTVEEIARLVDGVLNAVDPSTVIRDVVVDSRPDGISRTDPMDAMFVAIAGERVDGHDYAADAVARGCSVVLSARPLAPGGSSLPCIVVDDPVIALGRLARAVRRDRLTCRVVAITGSSGKTSTKDLLGAVLSSMGRTVSPRGSFNTEVGLPLTILSADEETQFLVLEMGMRGPGHIAYLVDIAQPDVGIVLNVGSAHLGMLGSRQAIADAKAELVAGLGTEALAVLNFDDPLVRSMRSQTPAHVVTFGESAEADVRALDVRLDSWSRASFTLLVRVDGQSASAQVSLQLVGEHFVSNALAVAAAALGLGAEMDALAAALSGATAQSKWRMEISETPGGYTVINDAYNANPESMRAALKTLVAIGEGRRTWAVLGEMRELGDDALTAHDELGRLAVRLDVSKLVCVGEGTRVMFLAASNEGSWSDESVHVADVDAAIELLRADLRPGDVVLVKASRSVGLERVAEALVEGGAG